MLWSGLTVLERQQRSNPDEHSQCDKRTCRGHGDTFCAARRTSFSENQQLPEWMRVDVFLGFLRPFYPSWDHALEQNLIKQFDLPLNRKLGKLSRRMRMKAALASALAFHPKLDC